MLETPVLLIGFNRPDTFEKVLTAISKVEPRRLYVAVDGPRPDVSGEELLVTQVQDLVGAIVNWDCELKTRFEDVNKGSREGVIAAIDWFFESEVSGIILEDDCLPHDDFFHFSHELLERFTADERVMAVLGDNTVGMVPHSGASYGFIKYSWPFGAFATWRRAWELYDRDLECWRNLRNNNKALRELWPRRVERKIFVRRLDDLAQDPGDIWDLQWSFSVDYRRGLSVYPRVNLVSNIGFNRSDSTHTRGGSLRAHARVSAIMPLSHPVGVENDKQAEDKALFGRMWGADRLRVRYWLRRWFRKGLRASYKRFMALISKSDAG